MGWDKALLEIDGETLARRAERVLRAVCDDVVEVGPGYSTLPATREDPPGAGPVAALLAGFDALRMRVVLLLAVDMPFIEISLLRMLARHPGNDTVVPVADGRLQVTCARYGAEALEQARQMRAGDRVAGESSPAPGLRDVVAASPHVRLEEAEWSAVGTSRSFVDVDTPDDLRHHGIGRHR